jgi:hypothetical protein
VRLAKPSLSAWFTKMRYLVAALVLASWIFDVNVSRQAVRLAKPSLSAWFSPHGLLAASLLFASSIFDVNVSGQAMRLAKSSLPAWFAPIWSFHTTITNAFAWHE